MNAGARPFARAALWLAVLGPFFFLSYGLANTLAGRAASVPSVVFGWEHGMPFWPWTIVPYWSIDVFYAVSFLPAARGGSWTRMHCACSPHSCCA